MIKALCEDVPKSGALLAMKAGVPIDGITISKKVQQLTDPSAISMALNYWSDLITTYQTSKNRVELANSLRNQISKFAVIISNYDLSIKYKPAIAVYFNACVKAWVNSNPDISLRTPIDQIASNSIGEYIIFSSTMKDHSIEEEEKKTTEKFKNASKNYNKNLYPIKYEKTADGETICRSFNFRENGCNLKWCNYKHVCSTCRSDQHAAKNCPKADQSQSNKTGSNKN